ncbi:MAG: DnaJ C-terminal domain-containing protein [Steroidobacteraceae bacterium]
MEFKNYYDIMGVARDASADQIKQAYRKLARKYHPDVSKETDAEARFKDVGEAYEVLRDPEKRAAYDQLGSGPRAGEPFQPPPDFASGFEFRGGGPGSSAEEDFGHAGDASEFFESLFGRQDFNASRRRSGGQRRRERGEDHHARVTVDLEASLEGGTRSLTLRLPGVDEQGRPVLHERTLNVKIPRGVLAGQHIRLQGQGEPLAGEDKPGDLYLEVQFAPHPRYRPEGRDLHLDLPVAPWEAALGASVRVPTPQGVVDLKVPPGSRTGTRLRLRGRGLPSRPPGDLYTSLQIVLPPADSEQARAAYAALAAALPFNPRSSLGV